jgi:hypothetical protein
VSARSRTAFKIAVTTFALCGLVVVVALWSVRHEREPTAVADKAADWGDVPPTLIPAAGVPSLGAREAVARSADVPQPESATRSIRVRARVHDAFDAPLANATLSVRDWPGLASEVDSAGLATLSVPVEHLGTLPRPCVFRVGAPGCCATTIKATFLAREDLWLGSIRLEPGGSIRGRIVSSDGEPIVGARVQCVEPVSAIVRPAERVFGGVWRGEATTSDAQGRFQLTGVPLGRSAVGAATDASFYSYSDPVEVTAGCDIAIDDLALERAGSDYCIRGTAFGCGAPVQVFLLNPQGLALLKTTQSNARGEFVFVVEPGDAYHVTVGRGADQVAEALYVRAGELFLSCRTADFCEVEVRGADGAPVEAVIGLESVDGTPLPVRTLASEKSTLAIPIPSAPGLAFSVVVSAVRYSSRRLGPYDATTCPRELKVLLERAYGIRGRVVAGGIPVPHAEIDAHTRFRNGNRGLIVGGFTTELSNRQLLTTRADLRGEFVIPLAPEDAMAEDTAELVVHAIAPGYALSAGHAVRVPWDLDRSLEIALTRGGSLSGAVSAPDVEGIVVGLSNGEGHVRLCPIRADSSYACSELAPGNWQVRLVAAGDQKSAAAGKTVSFTTAPPQWDVRIEEGRTSYFDLSAQEPAREAATLEGAIRVNGAPAGLWRWKLKGRDASLENRLAADGGFRATCQAGAVTLTLVPPTPGDASAFTTAIELRPGPNRYDLDLATSKIQLDVPVSDAEHPILVLDARDSALGVSWTCLLFTQPADGFLEFVPVGTVRVREFASQGALESADAARTSTIEVRPSETAAYHGGR